MLRQTLVDHARLRETVRAILVEVASEFPDQQIVFAAWSNGGAFAYEQARTLLGAVAPRTAETPKLTGEPEAGADPALRALASRVGGALLDCCPAQLTPHIGARATSEAARASLGDVGATVMYLLTYLMIVVIHAVGFLAGRGHRDVQWWNKWTHVTAAWPVAWHEVFLAAGADTIVPPAGVLSVAATRAALAKAAGARWTVESHTFADAGHVGTLRADADQYKRIARSLLTLAAKEWGAEAKRRPARL